jgi:hypothetical protein
MAPFQKRQLNLSAGTTPSIVTHVGSGRWIVRPIVGAALADGALAPGRTKLRQLRGSRRLNRHVERVFNQDRKDTHWRKTEAEERRTAILFAVPELTCNARIQLNNRVSLQGHAKAIA